jgi:hypothetical protein
VQLVDIFTPVIEIFVTPDNTGLLDNVAQPLIPLNEPIPGLSELTGKEITILDAGQAYPKAAKGVAAVRLFLAAYEKIKSFVEDFTDDGIIELADSCDALNGFKCTGALFGDDDADEERRLESLDDSDLSRHLQAANACPITKAAFDPENCSAVPCNPCSSRVNKAKCLKEKVRCKANSIDGLTFPFLADPKVMIGLFTGEDFVSCQRVIDYGAVDIRLNHHHPQYILVGTSSVCPSSFGICIGSRVLLHTVYASVCRALHFVGVLGYFEIWPGIGYKGHQRSSCAEGASQSPQQFCHHGSVR